MPGDILQITAKLDRSDPNTSWGFRMMGGKDFCRPLSIQRVTPGSLADKCGLRAGDTIVKIASMDTTDIPHKDAQHAIVNAGNYLELVLQRGGGQASRDLPNVYTMYDRTGSPARTYSPTPESYGQTSMSPQLQRMSLNTKPQPYQPYDEQHSVGGPQSKSFQRLVNALDNGEEIPTAYSPAPDRQRPGSRPNSGVWSQGSGSPKYGGSPRGSPKQSPKMTRRTQQYNSPAGLYSNPNVAEAYEKSFRRIDTDPLDESAPPRPPSPQQKLAPPQEDENVRRAPSPKSFPKFTRPVVEIGNSKPKPFVPGGGGQVKYEPTRIDDGGWFEKSPIQEQKKFQPTSLSFGSGRASSPPDQLTIPGNQPTPHGNEVRDRLSPLPSPSQKQQTPINARLDQQGYSVIDRSPQIDRKSPSRFLDENENKEPLHSRSFKILQQQLDSNTFGQEPLPPAIALRTQEPSPNKETSSVTVKQYNSPIGLYSAENAAKSAISVTGQQRHVNKDGDEVVTVSYKVDPQRPSEPLPEYDDQGRRIYRPQFSDTFKLIHERQKSGDSDKSDKSLERFGKEKNKQEPMQGRTMKYLQQHLEGGAPPPPQGHHGGQTAVTVAHVSAAPAAPPPVSPGWNPQPGANFNKPAPKQWTPQIGPNSPVTAPRAQGGLPRGAPSRAAPPGAPGGAVRGRKGEAVFSQPTTARIPICSHCGTPIRGPFVLALGKSWCPDHFKCANCGDKLLDIGFIEENGKLYCERDYEMYFAPQCNKCQQAIVGDCVHAMNQKYHPHCFVCTHCRQPIGSAGFHMEDGNPYCERDWAALYQTKCASCEFPIEPGDLWLEALGNHYHSGCFNCATCQVSLEGQSYFAKGGRAYCSKHAGGRF